MMMIIIIINGVIVLFCLNFKQDIQYSTTNNDVRVVIFFLIAERSRFRFEFETGLNVVRLVSVSSATSTLQ